MNHELLILIAGAIAAYFLVLFAHSLRHRYGLAHFHALIGCLTALIVWITDAGTKVEVFGMSLMLGSTVFFTALLLGAFVVYVFDGPHATRIVIVSIIGVSVIIPLATAGLHWFVAHSGDSPSAYYPPQSLRIYAASILTALADLIFLAIAWEFLGKPQFHVQLWARAFFTLLGVMWLDVILFSSGAFFGSPDYLHIMTGSFVSRFVICLFAFPFLYLYLQWQNRKSNSQLENRPVLAILNEFSEVRMELGRAQLEIERRRQLETEKESLIRSLQQALDEVKTLRGILPTCSYCKKIRDKQGSWQPLESYIQKHSDAQFSHGICDGCAKENFPQYNLTP
jgi:uncharacterized PurR-regulated membrane protein YhhQ (DUF165 family)